MSENNKNDHEKYLEKLKLLIKKKVEEIKLNKEQKEKIKHLVIKLPFKVPHLHTIETRATAPLTPIQMDTLNHLRLKYKSGPYTQTEDKIIERNWLKFCTSHHLENDPRPFMKITNISSKDERLKFLRFIARDLNDRLLHSVYKRFQLLHSNVKKGKFSQEENDTIINFMQHAREKHKFVALSKILQRNPLAIEKRHITLQKGEGRRIVWTSRMIAVFLRTLLTLADLKSYRKLQDLEIPPKIWHRMEKVMEIPVKTLKRGWIHVIYPRLFLKQSFLSLRKSVIEKSVLVQVNKSLINHNTICSLHESKINDWKSVDWNDMAKNYDGCNGRFLYKLIKYLVEEKVKTTIKNDARRSIEYLNKMYAEDDYDDN